MIAYLSEIRAFGFGIIPKGWAPCNGQLLPINQNQALFSLLGTQFGGNGVTTFALPDLRGRAMLDDGTFNGTTYAAGQVGGTENVTLLSTQIPQHNHMLKAFDGPGSQILNNADDYLSQISIFTTNPQSPLYSVNAYTNQATNVVALQPNTIAAAGGSQPHPNMQPYLAVNYCIALQGVFPSRD